MFIITAILAIMLVAGAAAVKLKFYRSPYCHAGLPLRTLALPEYCPYCTERLEQ